jgi:predicted dehydrogenase
MHKAVILGCAGRSDWHARAYELVKGAKLVACCDMADKLRDEFAAKFNLKAYADPEEMIRKEKPDLIHLVTRPSTRVEQLTMVSDLGVPACIVEKPIATGARDWKALRALASKTRTKIGVGAQFRYHEAMGRCREAVRSGRLGKPIFVEATAGSTMADQGVHVLDWAMSLNGDEPVRRVFGACSGSSELDTKHPSPDNTTAHLVFANDVYGLWTLGTEAPRVPTSYESIGRYAHCRAAVHCERGRVLFEEFGKWQIVSPAGVEGGEVNGMDAWKAGNDRAQANLTEAMLAWLDGKSGPVGTNLDRALGQWNAILGLFASALHRRPQEVPFDPADDLFEQLAATLKAADQKKG